MIPAPSKHAETDVVQTLSIAHKFVEFQEISSLADPLIITIVVGQSNNSIRDGAVAVANGADN